MHAVAQYQDGLRQLMQQLNEDECRLEAGGGCMGPKPLVIREKGQSGSIRNMSNSISRDIQPRSPPNTTAATHALSLASSLPRTTGLTDVRFYLDSLLVEAHQLLKTDLHMLRYWKTPEVSPTLISRRNQAIGKFRDSLAYLEHSLPPDAVSLRNHGISGSKSIIGLILQVKVAMILLKTSIDCGCETNFDQFYPQFEEIVSRVEAMNAVLEKPHSVSQHQVVGSHKLQLGVNYPLFFVAAKCRDWTLRRGAIKQLAKCGKDGVWEGPVMARVAQRIVQIEERGLQPNQLVPEGSRIHEFKKHPDHNSRTVRVEYRIAQDGSWEHWTTTREVINY